MAPSLSGGVDSDVPGEDCQYRRWRNERRWFSIFETLGAEQRILSLHHLVGIYRSCSRTRRHGGGMRQTNMLVLRATGRVPMPCSRDLRGERLSVLVSLVNFVFIGAPWYSV